MAVCHAKPSDQRVNGKLKHIFLGVALWKAYEDLPSFKEGQSPSTISVASAYLYRKE